MRSFVLAIAVSALIGCAGKESVAGGSTVKPAEKIAMAATSSEYGGGITAQASDKSATPAASSPGVSGAPANYQEFAKFRVDVEGLQINQDGSVVVILGYTNKIKNAMKIAIRKGGWGGEDSISYYNVYTKLFDDAGNIYQVRTFSMMDGELTVDPGNPGTASFLFSPIRKKGAEGEQKQPSRFTFTSTHIIKAGEGKEDNYTVSFRGIEPR